MQLFKNFLRLCCLATHLLIADCTINLEVTLHSYRNPTSSICGGSSCNTMGPACNNEFTFCLRSNLSSSCTFGNVTSSGEISDDDFDFSPNVFTELGLPNPISFQNFAPTEEIILEINISDSDNSTAPENVDTININIPVLTSVNVGSTFGSRQSYTGTCGRAVIELSYHLTCRRNGFALPDCTSCLPNFRGPNCNDCSPNYFPPGVCNVHCIPQNNASGHFTCDPQTGAILCLRGFTDPQTNCTTEEIPPTGPTSSLTEPTSSMFTTPTAIGAYVGAGLGALLLCCCAWCCFCMCLKWDPREERVKGTGSHWRECCQVYRKHCCCCCCCTCEGCVRACIACPAACWKACIGCPAACVDSLAQCAKECCRVCVDCPTQCAMACCKACIECPGKCVKGCFKLC